RRCHGQVSSAAPPHLPSSRPSEPRSGERMERSLLQATNPVAMSQDLSASLEMTEFIDEDGAALTTSLRSVLWLKMTTSGGPHLDPTASSPKHLLQRHEHDLRFAILQRLRVQLDRVRPLGQHRNPRVALPERRLDRIPLHRRL